jgi:hypothetical protein
MEAQMEVEVFQVHGSQIQAMDLKSLFIFMRMPQMTNGEFLQLKSRQILLWSRQDSQFLIPNRQILVVDQV